jgi:hypothetical protein
MTRVGRWIEPDRGGVQAAEQIADQGGGLL